MIELRWFVRGNSKCLANGEKVLQFRVVTAAGDWGPWTDVTVSYEKL